MTVLAPPKPDMVVCRGESAYCLIWSSRADTADRSGPAPMDGSALVSSAVVSDVDSAAAATTAGSGAHERAGGRVLEQRG